MSLFGYTYRNPEAFYLIALLPLLISFLVWQRKKRNTTYKTSLGPLLLPSAMHPFVMWIPFGFHLLALLALIVALARPVNTSPDDVFSEYTEGIDIVIAFDVSYSMLARDFKPDRLTVAREVAQDFIHKRRSDRIGLVAYESEAITMCPLTNDHGVLIESFNRAKPGMMEGGTAVGMGLATAINRLRESEAKSKVIILLTDGVNNSGNIDPRTAALIAKEFGIRTYTIGVGSRGMAMSPYMTPMGTWSFAPAPVEIDEDLLRYVAEQTGGIYYRATDRSSLEKIYEEIDQLERTKLNQVIFHREDAERFHIFALIALLSLACQWILRHTLFKSVYA